MARSGIRCTYFYVFSFLTLLIYGCATRSAPPPVAPIATPDKVARVAAFRASGQTTAYAGDAACAGCHAEVHALHRRSGHANSLQTVTPARYASLFRDTRRVTQAGTDTTWRVRVEGGKCLMQTEGLGGKQRVRAELAMGSGRKGQTFLGRDELKQWFVLGISHYTEAQRWDITPQPKPAAYTAADPKGQPLTPAQVKACLSCHATTLPMREDGPDMANTRPGVGCENCHGPARSHVEAMQASLAGRPSAQANLARTAAMERLKNAPAARIAAICGACHNTEAASGGGENLTGVNLARFQSTALEQSRCFQRSQTLSCITCHDPHQNASTNTAAYEKACLNCHQSAPSPPSTGAAAPALPRPASTPLRCKVNPTSGCIGCHMPRQTDPTFPHTAFHTHWIKIWR